MQHTMLTVNQNLTNESRAIFDWLSVSGVINDGQKNLVPMTAWLTLEIYKGTVTKVISQACFIMRIAWINRLALHPNYWLDYKVTAGSPVETSCCPVKWNFSMLVVDSSKPLETKSGGDKGALLTVRELHISWSGM